VQEFARIQQFLYEDLGENIFGQIFQFKSFRNLKQQHNIKLLAKSKELFEQYILFITSVPSLPAVLGLGNLGSSGRLGQVGQVKRNEVPILPKLPRQTGQ